MADPTVTGYAEALFAVAEAEGDLAAVEDELFRFAQALRSNDELRSTLADQGRAEFLVGLEGLGEPKQLVLHQGEVALRLCDGEQRFGVAGHP